MLKSFFLPNSFLQNLAIKNFLAHCCIRVLSYERTWVFESFFQHGRSHLSAFFLALVFLFGKFLSEESPLKARLKRSGVL